MAAGPAQVKKFADLAEAKSATITLIDELKNNATKLIELAATKETQQQKIGALMPEIQRILGDKIVALGFPPGPMGLMQGFGALTAAKDFEGGAVIQEALDLLKGSMMSGQVPSEEELNAMKAKLA